MKKVKLLFVLENLSRGGAQRYLYELINILDKEKFVIEILCGISSNWNNKKVIEDYYFLFKKIGIKTHRLIGKSYGGKRIIPFRIPEVFIKGLLGKIYRKIHVNVNPLLYKFFYYDKIKKLLNESDYLVVIDFYTYEVVKPFLNKKNNFEVHIMCHQIQYPDLYKVFEPNRKFKFFYFDGAQKKEIIANGFSNSFIIHQPLLINLDEFPDLYTPMPIDIHEPIKIGIFTRLSGNDKLIDIFIVAFASLVIKSTKKFKLLLVGEFHSDIKYVNHLKHLIRFMNISDLVEFHGNQSNLKKYLKNEKVHLAWHFSNGDSIGYAGIEISSYGIPSVLYSIYNVLEKTDEQQKNLSLSSEVTGIVEKTLFLSENPVAHRARRLEQIKYNKEHYDSKIFKTTLNEYYFNVSKSLQN